jgi:hypothetical protein
LTADAECDKGNGVSVDDRLEIRAFCVNLLVEGEFRRWFVKAFCAAIWPDSDDVFFPKGAFIYASGCDPDGAVVISDGEVAS